MSRVKNSIICLNAQGFLKHKDELEHILIKKFRPSIIGFTGTHVMRQIEDHELQIEAMIEVMNV